MAHNLNLALNDSCSGVSEVANFYDMLEKLYNFFRSVRHKNAAEQQSSIKASSDNTLVIKERCASIPSLFIWNSYGRSDQAGAVSQ